VCLRAAGCLLALVAAGCGASEELTCADLVVVDWNNGRLSNKYAPECYRDALETLPEDVRLYTTAPEAIKRALRASITARTPGRESAEKPAPENEAPATGRASRRLSGGQHAHKRASSGKTETTAAPAPEPTSGPTSLPWSVALTAALILIVCAGGVTTLAARRLRARSREPA
jgi:cobalamin biosynthesis Mg chelatase CobN